MRFRYVYMGLIGIMVLILLLLTDPDSGLIDNLPFGATTLGYVLFCFKSVLGVIFLHVSRKALMDYVDLNALFDKATTSSEGSGLAIIGVGLIYLSIALIFLAVALI